MSDKQTLEQRVAALEKLIRRQAIVNGEVPTPPIDFDPQAPLLRRSDTAAIFEMGQFLRDLISFIDKGYPHMTLNEIRERAARALRGEKL